MANSSMQVVQKLESWYDSALLLLPNFVVAVIALLFFVLLSKLVRRVLEKTLGRVSKNQSVNQLLVSTSYVLVILVGVFVALGVLRLDKTVTSLLAGIGVVGLALGFAFQDAASNLLSGVIMALTRPLRVGDIVETGGKFGKIVEIGVRTTTLANDDGQRIVIPNSQVIQNPFVNYSFDQLRRVLVPIGVAYSTDPDKLQQVAIDAVKALPACLKDKPVDVAFVDFGPGSINLQVRFWIHYSENAQYGGAYGAAMMALKAAFAANGIQVPLPAQTIELGEASAQRLASALAAKP